MGYASYFEDIIRRLDEGVSVARERRSSQVVDDRDRKLSRDLELLIGAATREIERLKNLTDLATDDQLDRAQLLIQLQAENEYLRKAIEISADGNLAERYCSLETENCRLQNLIDRDLVDEFYELDNNYVVLQERERKLLDQEARLLEKLKVVKQSHLEYVESQHTVVKNLEEKIKRLENLLEIQRAEDKNKVRQIQSLNSIVENKDNEIVELAQQNSSLQAKANDLTEELEIIRNPGNAYQRYSGPS